MRRRNQKPLPRGVRLPAYRRALQRLEAALEKNTAADNSERIRLLLRIMFGEDDEPAQDGTDQSPGGNH